MIKLGDKARAICSKCKQVRPTTYRVRSIAIDNEKVVGQVNVLTGVCDECNDIVSIPHQSVPDIKAAMAKL